MVDIVFESFATLITAAMPPDCGGRELGFGFKVEALGFRVGLLLCLAIGALGVLGFESLVLAFGFRVQAF